MGCAAAWALAERGADVTLYEQFDPEHTRGSSHGRTRIFRLAYPEPHWVELAQEALAGWRELEQRDGRELLALHGLVELCSSVEVTRATCSRRAASSTAARRETSFARTASSCPTAGSRSGSRTRGVVLADDARHAFLDVAQPHVATQHRVESLDDVDADVVVVTAGAWVTKLVPDLPVRVTRETVAYFARDGAPMPSVVELDDETRHHAMYALHDPLYGLKAGAHHGGPRGRSRRRGAGRPCARRRGSPAGCASASRTSTRTRSPRSPASTRDRGRVVRARAPRPRRRRLAVLGPRLQVRARVGRRLADLALG